MRILPLFREKKAIQASNSILFISGSVGRNFGTWEHTGRRSNIASKCDSRRDRILSLPPILFPLNCRVDRFSPSPPLLRTNDCSKIPLRLLSTQVTTHPPTYGGGGGGRPGLRAKGPGLSQLGGEGPWRGLLTYVGWAEGRGIWAGNFEDMVES